MAPKDIYPNLTRPPSRRDMVLRTGLVTSAIESMISNEQVDIHDYYLHLVESYGIKWNIEKCGRDSFQNFFDANGGTLDGIAIDRSVMQAQDGSPAIHRLDISGNAPFSYKELLHIGATTKGTGEFTAGGFGEGAKMLSLSLLRDHKVDRVMFRSSNWQLEFHLDDVPEALTDRRQKGLFARVATGLPHFEGSTMTILADSSETVENIAKTDNLFKSSENPDFQDMTIEKELPDGTMVGVKLLEPIRKYGKSEFGKGRLYIAGQRRHFEAPYSESKNIKKENELWSTVSGMTVSIGKDIVPGDRDRGAIKPYQLSEIYSSFADALTLDESEKLIVASEHTYGLMHDNSMSSESTKLIRVVTSRAAAKGLKIGFDSRYIAMVGTGDENQPTALVRQLVEKSGCIPCPGFLASVGMRTDAEFIKKLHEHQEFKASPEQLNRVQLLRAGIAILNETPLRQKLLSDLPIKLYENLKENIATNGTFAKENIWLAVENLNTSSFATMMATVLHENDHRFGGDESADFSYAMTDTLAQVLEAVVSNPEIQVKFAELSMSWKESQEREFTESNGSPSRIDSRLIRKPWESDRKRYGNPDDDWLRNIGQGKSRSIVIPTSPDSNYNNIKNMKYTIAG